jgi:phosphoribosylpyrophosphate synthetase
MIYLNQEPVLSTIFPDKSSQCWKVDLANLSSVVNCIKWDFENEGEFMQVCQLIDLVRAESKARLTLQMDYFPYARQDKEISNKSTFALRTFTSLLSNLNIDDIITVDLHSDVALGILPKITNVFPSIAIDRAINSFNPDVIVFPDLGADKRYSSYINYYKNQKPVFWRVDNKRTLWYS